MRLTRVVDRSLGDAEEEHWRRPKVRFSTLSPPRVPDVGLGTTITDTMEYFILVIDPKRLSVVKVVWCLKVE